MKSAIKVASTICLQPLNPLVSAGVYICVTVSDVNEVQGHIICSELQKICSASFLSVHLIFNFFCHFSLQPEEDDEEIQTAFLGWLHTQSHEPLACLTARSGTILLHGTDGDSFLHFRYKPKKCIYKSCTDRFAYGYVNLKKGVIINILN